MKILLTHGYFLKEDPKESIIMKPYPPLGILYISSYLEQNGFDNEVYDSTFSSLEELKNYFLEFKPDVLAIYVNLMTKLNVIKIIKFAKQNLSNVKIILGGPEIRYNADDFLNTGVDYLVIGEGEETTLELVSKLNEYQFEEVKLIPGIAYLNEYGLVTTNDERIKIKNVDELPYPNRKKINLDNYLQAWKNFHGESALSISTMRGCPYTCKWCSRAVYGLSYRRRSPEKVVEELKSIVDEYNPDTIWFVDDVFTISFKWLEKFAEVLNENKLKIKYECITRADRMNEHVIKMLKDSGCFRVWIGAESGSQNVIDLMDRRVDVNYVREMIKLTKQYGLQAGTFIMLGYPGETEQDIEETINHLKNSDPDFFTITVAYPIKGTELFYEVEALQISNYNFQENTDRDRNFRRTYPDNYYKFAVNRVTNEVNFHRARRNNVNFRKMFFYKSKSIISKMFMTYIRIAGSFNAA